MTRRYWTIDGGLQLLVETETATGLGYHSLNKTGQWSDGTEDAISYVFSGEPGAKQIQEAEAAALAGRLGSSLAAVPPLN